MRLAAAYVRARTLELARLPAFTVPTILFPALLYLAVTRHAATHPTAVAAGFAAIAVLGVAFFQFGVGIAAERVSAWERHLRTLPAGAASRIAGRVGAAGVFACCSAAAVLLAALARGGVSLCAWRWGALSAALLLGAVPFALLGTALGYLVPARAAVPIANLVYVPLAYVGGLWRAPAARHDGALVALPTRAWAHVLWASVGPRGAGVAAPLALIGWTVVFGLLAGWAYRRDEGERFR